MTTTAAYRIVNLPGYSQGHQVLAPTAANRLDDIDRRLGELEKRLKAGGL